MTWCARCDVLTTGSPGDECPTCGAPILDTESHAARRSRSSIQVLERDDPVVEVAAETAQETMETSLRPRLLSTRRSRVIASVLLAVIAGGSYAATRRGQPLANVRKAPAKATPSGPSWGAPDPPLGRPAPGFVLLADPTGFDKIDLTTGSATRIDVSGEVLGFSPAPGDGKIAYLDQNILTIVSPEAGSETPVAADVDMFAWEGTERIVVARSQYDPQGRARLRIERISVADRTSELLAETYANIVNIASRGGRVVATIARGESVGVYEVRPGVLRALRSDARLLDLSFNGRQALIAALDPGNVYLVDIRDRSAKRVGGSKYIAWAARFAPDGRTAVLSGTPHTTLETVCDDHTPEGNCRRTASPADHILSILDVPTLKLRTVTEWPMPYVASDPEWGPEGWLLTVVEAKPFAISLSTGVRIELPAAGHNEIWMPPQYTAE